MTKVTNEVRRAVFDLRKTGFTYREIAEFTGISDTTAWGIIKGIYPEAIEKDLIAHFFGFVTIPGDRGYGLELEYNDFGPCWIWQGAKTKAGYGNMSYRHGRDKHQYAHILSYMIFYGPVPDGKEVCHTCDNPPCVNPEHLWAGTHSQNMLDSVSKGRWGTKKSAETRKAKRAQLEHELLAKQMRKSNVSGL